MRQFGELSAEARPRAFTNRVRSEMGRRLRTHLSPMDGALALGWRPFGLGRQLGATRAGRQSEGRCYAWWSNFGRFPEIFPPPGGEILSEEG